MHVFYALCWEESSAPVFGAKVKSYDNKIFLVDQNGHAKSLQDHKTDIMNAEIQTALNNEIQKIAEIGFLHDKIFSSIAVRVSRLDVLKSVFSLAKPQTKILIEKQSDQSAA